MTNTEGFHYTNEMAEMGTKGSHQKFIIDRVKGDGKLGEHQNDVIVYCLLDCTEL
jgi:hypothetical protein